MRTNYILIFKNVLFPFSCNGTPATSTCIMTSRGSQNQYFLLLLKALLNSDLTWALVCVYDVISTYTLSWYTILIIFLAKRKKEKTINRKYFKVNAILLNINNINNIKKKKKKQSHKSTYNDIFLLSIILLYNGLHHSKICKLSYNVPSLQMNHTSPPHVM